MANDVTLDWRKHRDLSRQEKQFAEAYVNNGGFPFDAYREAYDTSEMQPADVSRHAAQVLVRPKIALYISELRREVARQYAIERDAITEELLHNITHSRAKGNMSAHRKAVMDLAKLHGLVVERQDVTQHHNLQVMKEVVIDGTTIDFQIGDGKVIDADTLAELGAQHTSPALQNATHVIRSSSDIDDLV